MIIENLSHLKSLETLIKILLQDKNEVVTSDSDHLFITFKLAEIVLIDVKVHMITKTELGDNVFAHLINHSGDLIGTIDFSENIITVGDEEFKISGNTDGSLYCHLCGKEFFIDDRGVANHGSPDSIDHDADAEHTPYSLDYPLE